MNPTRPDAVARVATVPTCSALFRQSGAPMAGTATQGDGYLFLPVPMKLWGFKGFDPRWISADAAAEVSAFIDLGIRIRLFDPIELEPRRPLYFGNGDHFEALSAFSQRLGFAGPITPDRRSVFVCCHGKRERCCARWGQATVAALRSAPDIEADIYRCSHLGGDRFAATAIIFPSGSMYGALDASSAPVAIGKDAAGSIHSPNYRGCVFESEGLQLVRHALASEGIEERATAPIELSPWQLRANVSTINVVLKSGQRFSLNFARRSFQYISDCDALAENLISRVSMLEYIGHD